MIRQDHHRINGKRMSSYDTPKALSQTLHVVGISEERAAILGYDGEKVTSARKENASIISHGCAGREVMGTA
jgi:hypothetical protein